MTTPERDYLTTDIFLTLKSFSNQLLTWIDDKSGEMHDPFETIYAEGYGPGCATHILSGLFHKTGEERYLKGALVLLKRVFYKIQNPTDNSKFTDIFLYFFGLKGYDLIREQCPISEKKEFEMRFKEISYDFTPHNTNGYCLLLSTSMLHSMMGFGVFDFYKANKILNIIKDRQNRKGFIDDNFKEDMKPIAYHLFSCAVLAEALRWYKRYRMKELSSQIERIEEIVIRGLRWADHFIASDGSISMTERSRDQFWTAGVFIYLLALRGALEAESVAKGHILWWMRFLKGNGTISITPNYFPNSLRVGFEFYSTSTMYNTLGFSYLCDALLIPENDDFLLSLPYPKITKKEVFIDKKAGYLHLRNNKNSLGLSLRRHEGGMQGGYCPAGGIFNLVLDGDVNRIMPSPNYRFSGVTISVPNSSSEMVNNGVYEGYRAFRRDVNWGSDFTKNAKIRKRNCNQIILKKKYNSISIVKSISLSESSLKIFYIFRLSKSLDKLFVTFPILLSDGKNEITLDIRGYEVFLNYSGSRYRLSCGQNYNWIHDQERYLLSGNGITSQLYFKLGESLKKGTRLKSEIIFEKIL